MIFVDSRSEAKMKTSLQFPTPVRSEFASQSQRISKTTVPRIEIEHRQLQLRNERFRCLIFNEVRPLAYLQAVCKRLVMVSQIHQGGALVAISGNRCNHVNLNLITA